MGQKKKTSLSRTVLLVSVLCTVIPSLIVGIVVHNLLYHVQMEYVEDRITTQTDILSESVKKITILFPKRFMPISANTTVRTQISWQGESGFSVRKL